MTTNKNRLSISLLGSNRQTIQINPNADCFADVQAFAQQINDPEKVIELYDGDFLLDYYIPDSETFAEKMSYEEALEHVLREIRP